LNLELFPLQTVLFPGGLLNLKVFEARYLDLVGECLRSSAPFGVVCLQQGSEAGPSPHGVRVEAVGTLARIDEVDAEQTGILRVRCTGTHRFRMTAAPAQQPGGLWTAPVDLIDDDEDQRPQAGMRATVDALAQAVSVLDARGTLPFASPMRFDDAGWVANRWCELLPISLAAKQKLMELDDPAVRLKLVDEFLRSKNVVKD
jgi:hypothetical protein